MNPSRYIRLQATAVHMVDNLATGLYEDEGQRVMELIRNGLVASMSDPNSWEPKKAKIELLLVPNHPLAPKGAKTLIVLDHGSGMTDAGLERYFNWLGTPLKELKKNSFGSFYGASQKGIGRLAALALNKHCLDGDYETRVKNGYYLLSRTQSDGDVRYVRFIPEMVEDQGFDIGRFIDANAFEMGPLCGIKGSFTAIVIPTPVFDSEEEVYSAIKWKLPREQDKMFTLLINGKPYGPPPLESTLNITSRDGKFRARLGTVENGESVGAWLCDEVTGIRVASCLKHRQHLPDPLWYPNLVGDIFAPDLLRHQNTARSALNSEYTRKGNKEWKRLVLFLISQVVPPARQLFERDAITGDAAETLNDVVELFHDAYGVPGEGEGESLPKIKNPASADSKPRDAHSASREKRERNSPSYRRHITIKVGDEIYTLYRGQELESHVFAEVSISNRKVIIVNVRGGYKALPSTKSARREHCLMQILSAIGRSEHFNDPREAMVSANKMRAELLEKKVRE